MKSLPNWKAQVVSELKYSTTRAQGAGGQHVNRTDSAVVIEWDLKSSAAFSTEDKSWLQERLRTRLVAGQYLQLRSQEERSQFRNKEIGIKKILELLEVALVRPKKRVATKPKKSSILKRLQSKTKLSQKKELRRRVLK